MWKKEKEKEKSCNNCNTKKEKELLFVEIGIFKDYLCHKCYMIKMLENIYEKIEVKDHINYSAWIKQKEDNTEISIERIWCTKCDCNMKQSEQALDCPDDGLFFICPTCKHRIVVFEKDNK